MDKNEFLTLLQKCLAGLPQEEMDERLNFYSEMIEDYIEEGLTEQEAINRIGSVNEIASQILADNSPAEPATKQRNPWKTAMIIVFSPVWIALQLSGLAVIISLFVSFWAVIASLWSIFASFASCAFGGALGSIFLAITGHGNSAAATIGSSLILAGLSVFTFLGCKAATKGAALLTKKLASAAKSKLLKKEAAK